MILHGWSSWIKVWPKSRPNTNMRDWVWMIWYMLWHDGIWSVIMKQHINQVETQYPHAWLGMDDRGMLWYGGIRSVIMKQHMTRCLTSWWFCSWSFVLCLELPWKANKTELKDRYQPSFSNNSTFLSCSRESPSHCPLQRLQGCGNLMVNWVEWILCPLRALSLRCIGEEGCSLGQCSHWSQWSW